MFFYGEEFGFRYESACKRSGEVINPLCFDTALEMKTKGATEDEIEAFLDELWANKENNMVVELCSAIANDHGGASKDEKGRWTFYVSKDEKGRWTFYGEDFSVAVGADKADARDAWMSPNSTFF